MQKNQYEVYQVDHLNYGNGNTSLNKIKLCTIFADSEQCAIEDVRSSWNIKPEQLYCEYNNGGYRRSELVAEVQPSHA